MIVLVFVTLTDRAEAQVPEQYSAFTEPKAEAGGTRAQLSAPLPHLCPLPPPPPQAPSGVQISHFQSHMDRVCSGCSRF